MICRIDDVRGSILRSPNDTTTASHITILLFQMAEKEIPTDILDSLEKCFPPESDANAETLGRIIFFLADALAEGVAHPYIRSLQAGTRMPNVFQKVAVRMAEDTKSAEKDPKYR